MLRDLRSCSNRLGFGTREYNKRYNHRIIVVAEGVLEVIPHILSVKHNGSQRGALGLLYIPR